MRIYISADIEGITGTTHWDETERNKPDYGEFRDQMTAEIAAACEGALDAGATEVWVKDAHDSARNIIASKLPKSTKLVRGWSGHPFGMVEGLDDSFHALLLVGYHSRSGSSGNPLSHTLTEKASRIKINDRFMSEFSLSLCSAALVGVPVAFVSGDEELCAEVLADNPNIKTVSVKHGIGDSTISLHPSVAIERIKSGVTDVLKGDVSACRVELPEYFMVEIQYRKHIDAYKASFYPNASLEDPHTIQFGTDDYFEVLRLLSFVL